MRMLRLALCVAVLLGVGLSGAAQMEFDEFRRQTQERFEQFRTQQLSEFEAYRDRVNQEYAEFMSRVWPEYKAEPAIPVPPSPEPRKPIEVSPNFKPSVDQLPFSKIKPKVPVQPQPTPLLPNPTPASETIPTPQPTPTPPTTPTPREDTFASVSFDFYGKMCSVPFDDDLRISLSGNSEKIVSQAWQRLAKKKSLPTVEACVNLYNNLRLSDWGYLKLVEKLSQTVFPGKNDEATLLQMFLLTQSGYKVRIGRNGSQLTLLVPCNEQIYNYQYVPIKGVNYYIIHQDAGTSAICVYDHEFPREQMFSLVLGEQPVLPVNAAFKRHFASNYKDGISVDVATNKNLIAFYNDYPLSNRWDIYAYSSLSDDVKEQLYPALTQAISGKSHSESANILLRFVQNAFDYKTDEEQFGTERPFFADETFYYPYSDCEDRAILYSVLVRELLGLHVALVRYPGHLATAVKFDEDVYGDYFSIDGEKYVVCDPTYINADIGMSMPTYQGVTAEIIKL